jgi:SAM-dependent methyltransferase
MEPLTNESYWEKHFENAPVVNQNLARQFEDFLPFFDRIPTYSSRKMERIFEVGCFPGRYLHFLSQRWGVEANGIDFVRDFSPMTDFFRASGTPVGELIQGDFFKTEPSKKYDLVLSIGFIEHFPDPTEILKRQAQWVSDGGLMMVTVPNKRFLRIPFAFLFDQKNQDAHVLTSMRISYFQNAAQLLGWELLDCRYVGGFNSKVHQPLHRWQMALYRPIKFVFKKLNPWLKKNPSKWYSHTLMAVYRLPASNS